MSQEKKSALKWLMDTYDYRYSPQLAGMAKAVQAYGDYVQQLDRDIARDALNDILRELCEITGLPRSAGYIAHLNHIKSLLKQEKVQ